LIIFFFLRVWPKILNAVIARYFVFCSVTGEEGEEGEERKESQKGIEHAWVQISL
jgi:hypothetical protein